MSSNMDEFRITRIYSDSKGESHFEDINFSLENCGEIGFLSENMEATSIRFRNVVPGYDYDFHNAPKRQLIFLLDGAIQIETSLGDIRKFTAGDVLLVEDIQGKGHRTKNLTPVMRKSAFVEIPEDLDISSFIIDTSKPG